MKRSTLLNTDTEDLKEILGNGKSYIVPPYQRDYSWRQENWEDLWEDLEAIEKNNEDHYMGALVLETNERKQSRIIDGQQRLATISILIMACIDYLLILADKGIDSAANRERASLLEGNHIGAKDPSSLRVAPKLKLNSNDDDFFQLNIAQRKPPHGGVRTLRDSERLMWECFNYFKQKIESKFKSKKTGQDVSLFIDQVVTERLIFISVRVQDQLSAYTVFETLNARGLELTETDLLKNYLLSLADRLSRSQMEPVLKQWARITNKVGVSRFPEFLRHHMNSRRRYVRQRQLFKSIKKEIVTIKAVFSLLDDLEEDAVWFDALRDHGSGLWLDFPGAKEHVRVLNLFGVSQYIPLVLAAKDAIGKDIAEILRYCSIITIRFNAVGKRSTHSLEESFNRAALDLRKSDAPSSSLVRTLLAPIYISDDEFEADFSVYRISSSGKAAKRLKYILVKIENQIEPKDISDETTEATIEHILPENPDSEWGDSFSDDEKERYSERLGNYSLLEKKLNSQLAGNCIFREKIKAFEKSRFRLSRDLCAYSEWNPAVIDERQRKLAKIAKSVWKL